MATSPFKNQKHRTDIPSFYKNSYVLDEYSAIKRPEIINEILYTDYDSTHHVRIMKHFQTPNDPSILDETERKWHENPGQKDFFLRCYLPKSKISHRDPKHRIQQVIIMFNGLNECAKYDFYDVMGAQFAEHGIATILLPTPFHLSRRVPRDNKCTALRSMIKQSKTRDYEMPTDIAFGNEALYLYNFKRSIKELENLVDRIRHPFMDDYGFFHTYFTQDPQITLFGFSLGGLRALACFLRNPDSYHSCITFNSTVNLGEINTEALNLNPKVWKETFSAIGDLVDKGDFILGQKNDEDILNLFRWLYLKGTKDKLANRLKEHSTKYLSIQSGADPLAKDENAMGGNISVRDHGLNRYIVAGVGHVPTRDLRWDNWLSKVGETIVHFIKGCEEVHWPHAELEGIIYELIKETPFFKNLKRKKKLNFENFDFSFKVFEDLKGQIRELGTDEDVDRFVELYYISKAFYPKFAELLEKILK